MLSGGASAPEVSPPRQRRAPAAQSRRAPAAGEQRRYAKTGARHGLGGEQVEGRHAVRELLAARRRNVRELWVADGADVSPVMAEILDLAAASRVPVRSVSRERLEAKAATGAPQGVVARAAPLAEADLDDLVRPRGGRAPFLLAVDGITDPHNLGALLRTAECAGATGAALPRHRAVHVTPAVAKAAAGAIEHLPMTVVAGLPAALTRLRRSGVWTVGLDPTADQSLFDLTLGSEPVAVVLGAEGGGLSRLARQRCDVAVRIPQRGSLPSLNVAAAGAVAFFELARHRHR